MGRIRQIPPSLLAGAALLAASLALIVAAPAGARVLLPAPGKTYFGVTDTGVTSQFAEFSEAVGKHPAVIETFRSWNSKLRKSIRRWQQAVSRPVLHLTTADPGDGHEILTPRGIALGKGDAYLLRVNHMFWAKHIRAYLRPLGEPNRCRNVYAAFDCAGKRRGGPHKPYWYRQAFRRMYILLHGGGKRRVIDARLRRAGLPPLHRYRGRLPGGIPRAPIAVIWSTLPAGSPIVPGNRPRHYYPGADYVDWVGTDFYADYPDWRSLTGLYRRYRAKPFALTEWGLSSGDDPGFVKRLMTWVQRHRGCRMLVYYQDFGEWSAYRIQNYPNSLAVLRRRLAAPTFAAYAPGAPHPPPPPPGGVGPS